MRGVNRRRVGLCEALHNLVEQRLLQPSSNDPLVAAGRTDGPRLGGLQGAAAGKADRDHQAPDDDFNAVHAGSGLGGTRVSKVCRVCACARICACIVSISTGLWQKLKLI